MSAGFDSGGVTGFDSGGVTGLDAGGVTGLDAGGVTGGVTGSAGRGVVVVLVAGGAVLSAAYVSSSFEQAHASVSAKQLMMILMATPGRGWCGAITCYSGA
jgi:hypothetical protein